MKFMKLIFNEVKCLYFSSDCFFVGQSTNAFRAVIECSEMGGRLAIVRSLQEALNLIPFVDHSVWLGRNTVFLKFRFNANNVVSN